METIKRGFILVILLLISGSTFYGWSDWLTLKTEHFTVFYQPGNQDEAKQVLQTNDRVN
jgi:hypothetical protein